MGFGADQSHLFGLRRPSKLTIQVRQRQRFTQRQLEIGGIVNRSGGGGARGSLPLLHQAFDQN